MKTTKRTGLCKSRDRTRRRRKGLSLPRVYPRVQVPKKAQVALRAAPALGLHTSDKSQGANKKGDEEAAKNQEEELAN
jgi:hypothetical protein